MADLLKAAEMKAPDLVPEYNQTELHAPLLTLFYRVQLENCTCGYFNHACTALLLRHAILEL